MFPGKTVFCPYLSALENAVVFKGALQMSRLTLILLYLQQHLDALV